MLKAYIDGACAPKNPGGMAAYGLAVYEGNKQIYTKAAIVDKGKGMSSNVAEYSSLIAFLEWYRASGNGREATILSDSQLVINQMQGKWRVHGGLYLAYYEKASEMVCGIYDKLQFKWIPREQNWEADKLAGDILRAHGVEVEY